MTLLGQHGDLVFQISQHLAYPDKVALRAVSRQCTDNIDWTTRDREQKLRSALCWSKKINSPPHFAFVVDLLQDRQVDSYSFRLACQEGHDMIVAYMLQDERLDPSVWNNMALTQACTDGKIAVVEVLLQDSRVVRHPGLVDELLISGSREGQLELVELLLQDPRVSLLPGVCLRTTSYRQSVTARHPGCTWSTTAWINIYAFGNRHSEWSSFHR